MRLPRVLETPAYAAYRALAGRLRSSRVFLRAVFGQAPLPPFGGPYWDWTTLDLRRILPGYLAPGARFLDMGTGPFAVLAVFAARSLRPGRVAAVDCLADVVESARRHVRAAGVDVDVLHGDLFAPVTGDFDVIAFNPPYVDSGSGSRLGVYRDDRERARWDGGPDGLGATVPFLARAADHLAPGGRVLLGSCHFFVDPATLAGLIRDNGFVVERTVRFPLGLSHVYVLARGQ